MPMATPELQRAYQREWKAKRKAEFFEGKSCARCRATEDLTLDHLDRTAKVDHKIWSWRKERRDAELAKCQVICVPCHRKKTNIEIAAIYAMKPPPDHGGEARYRRGCRCDPCRAAHSVRMRTPEQRARVRESMRRREARAAAAV